MMTSATRLASRVGLLATAAAGFALGPVSPVAAEPATVTKFVVVHEPQTFTAAAFCLPEELLGTVTTQETSTGTSVETSSGVFAVRGVDNFTYRIDFSDGSYVEAGIDRDLFMFNATPAGSTFNRVTQDFETIYASDGSVVGTIAVNAVFHTSWRDANRNGIPDDGELATQVDTFKLRCR